MAEVFALLWTYRTRAEVHRALDALAARGPDGKRVTQDAVRQIVHEMLDAGALEREPRRDGFYRLREDLASEVYGAMLSRETEARLFHALHIVDSIPLDSVRAWWPLYDVHKTAAFVRLALYSGWDARHLAQFQSLISGRFDWDRLVFASVVHAFDGALFERVAPEVRADLLITVLGALLHSWEGAGRPLCDWFLAQPDEELVLLPVTARSLLAEVCLMREDGERMHRLLDGLDDGYAEALRAAWLVHEGRWAEAQTAFEAAIKRLQVETGTRKRVLPPAIAWLYPMALLAVGDAKALDAARRFCAAQSGSRKTSSSDGWSVWVHALRVRQGETPFDSDGFDLTRQMSPHRLMLPDLFLVLTAAWLGIERFRLAGADERLLRDLARDTTRLRETVEACGLSWPARLADDAFAVLRGEGPAGPFFVQPSSDLWREVLAQLQTLDAASEQAAGESIRLVWLLTLGDGGWVDRIDLLEQKLGPRGWGRGKAIGFGRLLSQQGTLAPHDQRMVAAVSRDPYDRRRGLLDRGIAVTALVGHPCVAFADAPDTFVDLTPGTPELEVAREGDRYVLRVFPEPHDENEIYNPQFDLYRDGDEAGLRFITVVRDSPQRARVIRLTAQQQRAAQLLGHRFALPVSAQADLDRTLRALASQFQVHSDSAQASREVAPDTRLRAELSPAGEGLALRLAVAPLGEQGPRFVPGAGRERVMAAFDGETVGTRRDLARERAGLEGVLDAIPFLDDAPSALTACEWTVSEPELALSLVETLPGLEAVAGIDWPKGRSVRVASADVSHLSITVRKDREWFRLGGQVAVDESLVMDFEALLAASRGASRFVALGDGAYLALTHSLKQRLAEIAAVAEADKHGSRVAPVSAAWLRDVLDGAAVQTDRHFEEQVDRLQRAQAQTFSLPTTLQAELREYQEEGFVWASRLAAAGFGGCLADDMGLGKTLQALAVLLARASGGPALVVAPTSVCGNWIAEGGRFAPSLSLRLLGEQGRDAQIADAGPGDVIVVSYTLLLQAQEAFAARHWHTVIADEAQAIKNAAAKRSLAMFDLEADFRLALSGTPVENRLAELWSILRFVNPGLLGTLTRFNERFAGPIERSRDREAQRILKRLIGPFILRRTKAQVLQELPPRTELVITVTPDAPEAAFYEAVRREAVAEVKRDLAAGQTASQARLNILAQLTKLRRVACDPRLASGAFPAPSAKVQAFARLCADLVANHHKALVFSQFVDFLHLLRAELDRDGIAYQYLDGATAAAERTKRVAAFQGGAGDLFLISLKAGGFGLNLTAADYVVITDPWWNPAAEDQAMGRAHRIGQVRPVTVYRLVTAGTVEERIVALHQEKRALAEGILDEGDGAVLPSTEDLVALIRGD